VDNLQHCTNCGWPIEPDDKFCRNCGKPFEEKHEQAPPPSAPPIPPVPPPPPTPPEMLPPSEPPEEKYVPWEDRQRLGFFAALWKTWAESVFNPERFYSKLPFKGGLGSPILYALIITWLGAIVNTFYQVIFANFWLNIVRDYIDQSNPIFNMDIGRNLTIFSFLQTIFIAPIVILFGLFIISGIYHLICMIFGWAKRDFEATLRAVSYSVGPAIFVIIPMCGSPIGWVWSLILAIIGLKHMQQTTGGKAAIVALLPLILCCCLIFALALIFGTAILALIKGASQSGYGF
jgi:hypothetical protein